MKNLNIIFNLFLLPFLFLKRLDLKHFVIIVFTFIFTSSQLYAACLDNNNEGQCTSDPTGCVWYNNGGGDTGCIDAPTPPVISGIPDQVIVVNTVFTPLDLSTYTTEADGDTVTYSTTALPNGLDLNATTGVISGTPDAEGVTSVTVTATDKDGNTNDDFNITVISSAPDLNITKTASTSSIEVDHNITYAITVRNYGNANATNVVVTDNLPSDITVLPIPDQGNWTCSLNNLTLVCTLNGELAIGASANIDFNITVPSDDGIISNEASVSCDDEVNLNDNSSTVDVYVFDTDKPSDLCYTDSIGVGSQCTSTGGFYYGPSGNHACTASTTIVNRSTDNLLATPLTTVTVYKLYDPNATDGSCSVYNCSGLSTSSIVSGYGSQYEYTTDILGADSNITITDIDTYSSSDDVDDIMLYGSYAKDGNTYSGEIQSCSSFSVTPIESYVDVVDASTFSSSNYATAPIIQTKVSKKDNQQLTAVYIDYFTYEEKIYTDTLFGGNAPLIAFLYRTDGATCTDELALAEPVTGSPVGEPVVATIISGTSNADTNTFTMKAIANRDTRIRTEFIDFSNIFDGLDSLNSCFVNSSWEGNFNGLPQCLNNLGSESGIAQELAEKFPNIETICLQDDIGKAACDSSSYNSEGSVGGIYPAKYDHAYGCLACILDAVGEAESCSKDNFAIRPDYFDIDTLDTDFPNLLRSGQDYNMTIYAYDYGITSGTDGTVDYNQSKTNMEVNESIILAKDGSATVLDGNTDWTNDDFNMTNGVSGNGSATTEVAGLTFDDVGKVTITVKDKNWAAVDINKVGGADTPEDCTPDGAYVCGDKNVTFIPHHFRVDDIHLRDHGDGNFTYLSNDLNMSAHVDITISAMNANDNPTITIDPLHITENFRQGSAYYENPVSVDMNITEWLGAASRHPKGNSTHKHDIPTETLLGFGGSDINGTHIIPWNETNTTQQLMFNYTRQNNQTVNPFEINGTDINISVQSTYIDSTGLTVPNTAVIDGSGISDRNATFYFGRTRASKFFYEDITADNAITPIAIDVYCDFSDYDDCKDLGIKTDTGARTNELYWWLSLGHDATGEDGNVTLQVGTLIEGTGTPSISSATTDPANVRITSGGIQTNVTVTANATQLPLTVPIELVNREDTSSPGYGAFASPYTNSWLIYNEESATNVPSPFYKVRFIGNSAWTGTGITGDVVNINASRKKSKKMDW